MKISTHACSLLGLSLLLAAQSGKPAVAQENTHVGTGALVMNTTGVGNEAFGANALYYNTTGSENVANGFSALAYNTIGNYNLANGSYSLLLNKSGSFNTANGYEALYYNTTGNYNSGTGVFALFDNSAGVGNSASGYAALYHNTTGSYNTAAGYGALYNHTTATYDTALGAFALFYNTTGSNNIAVGQYAGYNSLSGSNNIEIGSRGSAADNAVIRLGTPGAQTVTYVAGVSGANVTGGVAVVVNSLGQLGVVSSSRRYKEDIRSMGDASDRLLALRPVTFRYKKAEENGKKPEQYGLIAEEVAQVMPELVVYNQKGQPETVAYQTLAPLLLNELQREHRQVQALQSEVAELRRVTARLAATRGRAMGEDKPDGAIDLPQ